MAPTEDISVAAEDGGLRPCTSRGGEESLEGAAGDGVEDTLEGVEICDGVDSASGAETIGGTGADMGDPDTAEAAEALVRDADTGADDGDAES